MYFNPDNIKIEKPKSFSQDIKKQERYLDLINRKAEPYTPKEKNFSDIYSQEEIDRDLALVEELRKKFKESETEKGALFKRISDIYEGVIVEQAEQNNWFGNNVTFYPTSKYDDFVSGVDGVAEFFPNLDSAEEKEVSHAALSFDVVFSADSERILKKLERTKKSIDNGELTEVKYFEDDNGEKKKIKAPRIVLGSRLSSAEKLINLWGSKVSGRNELLAQHPIQVKLLLESYIQLNHFSLYASEVGQSEIAYEYGVLSNRIADIINTEKSQLVEEYFNEISDDIVFDTIKNYCDKTKI